MHISATPRFFAKSHALQTGKGNMLDELLTILWLIVLPLEFPMAAPLRYPVALLMLVMIGLHWRDMIPALKRARLFFLLPALALLSALWAAAPFEAIRFAVLMSIGLLVALYTATRLNHRQFVVAVLISSTILMVASLFNMQRQFVGGIDGGYAVIGVFPQKNVLGVRMLILSFAGLIALSDKNYDPVWRLLGGAILLPAAILLFKAQSATAVLLYLALISLLGFLVLIWRAAIRVRGLRALLLSALVAIGSLGGLLLSNLLRFDPWKDGLQALGKSTTLTGRTDIWQVALDAIEKNPLLGVGAGNFWRDEVNAAVIIANQFQHEGSQFYFHNAYLESGVALGLPGMLLFIALFFTGLFLLVRHWWQNQSRLDPFFVAIAMMLFLRSFTESEMFSTLLMNPLILWVGVFFALGQANPVSPPAPRFRGGL